MKWRGYCSATFRLLFSVSDILSPNLYSLEWWSFEGLILLSGLLPNPKTETSVLSIWYMLLFSTLFFFWSVIFLCSSILGNVQQNASNFSFFAAFQLLICTTTWHTHLVPLQGWLYNLFLKHISVYAWWAIVLKECIN